MTCFDVFSVNGYRDRVDRDLAAACEAMGCLAMIGEWHFGALDVGLPATGIGRVETQADRGRAFRIYTEDAAAQPWCVGVHYFTLYDQSALGRFDGENYNIGFVDICHRSYAPLAEAARAAHERIYPIAGGPPNCSTTPLGICRDCFTDDGRFLTLIRLAGPPRIGPVLVCDQ